MIVGVLNRFEIWAPEAWASFLAESERLLDDVSLDLQWPVPPTPSCPPPTPRVHRRNPNGSALFALTAPVHPPRLGVDFCGRKWAYPVPVGVEGRPLSLPRDAVMLRGNHPARIDDKGRLKIPNGFRTFVESQYGSELFATSVTGEFVRLYPMSVWLEIERKLAAVPTTNPSKQRFLDRVNFFGQAVQIDKQGRVLVPQILRETAAMTGEVSVLGLQNHLAVWNQKRLQERLFKKEPFTDEDGRVLSEFGI